MGETGDSQPTELSELSRRSAAYRRWFHARQPKKIGNVVAQVMQRTGYAQAEAARQIDEVWQKAAGEGLARTTRVGKVRRGRLEIMVASSLVMQELTFQKKRLLADVQQELPEMKIESIRFRVGKID